MKHTTKIFLPVVSAITISMGMMPTFPANAANGEITCDRLIRNNGYSVVASRGGRPVYRDGRTIGYRYVYRIRNRRYGVRTVDCVWNERRDAARLIYR
ncbi:hypothetical protein G7B40_002930 [Aetokthonos hydrillicola Thurmond2011]|uniref:Secreted protein n=1 Tax=Aetokthonos hydrillicola Thurmond2011 TaxID=2712845 RepID=A0AAP5M5W6_9CYAN|nr:hypothetical protein [Aetokthonos hydrillicola]MBO3459371.1 hypothetical protein [Aetokthonos hydrillicola CCALA 1050]MBW4586517.1 hypothetical protein [Aetokthonos hydrillicola CCALA 1050]MDR9893540.1 hypothetical protein [Aetokthonos hydrillicola Thurmond2011]